MLTTESNEPRDGSSRRMSILCMGFSRCSSWNCLIFSLLYAFSRRPGRDMRQLLERPLNHSASIVPHTL